MTTLYDGRTPTIVEVVAMVQAQLPRARCTLAQRIVVGLTAAAWSALTAGIGWIDAQIVTFTVWLTGGTALGWLLGLVVAALPTLLAWTPLAAWALPRLRARARAWLHVQHMHYVGAQWRAASTRLLSARARADGPVRVQARRVQAVRGDR